MNIKENFQKNKTIWIVVIICVFVGIIGSSNYKKETTDENNQTQNQEQNNQQNTSYSFSQNDAEEICQEASILNNNIPKNRNIHVIDIWNYNSALYEHTTGKDKDGNDILMFQWNGSDKDTDKNVRFTCYFSGKDKNNVKVHQIMLNTETIYGTSNFEVYNDKGDLQK